MSNQDCPPPFSDDALQGAGEGVDAAGKEGHLVWNKRALGQVREIHRRFCQRLYGLDELKLVGVVGEKAERPLQLVAQFEA